MIVYKTADFIVEKTEMVDEDNTITGTCFTIYSSSGEKVQSFTSFDAAVDWTNQLQELTNANKEDELKRKLEQEKRQTNSLDFGM